MKLVWWQRHWKGEEEVNRFLGGPFLTLLSVVTDQQMQTENRLELESN
jgi:hypothetical protein